MKKFIKKAALCLLLSVNVFPTFAQALQHPVIWTTNAEHTKIANNIKDYAWAKSVVAKLHNNIDKISKEHKNDPKAILATMPALGGNSAEHNKLLSTAAEAGMLYYITNDKSYAQLSADIISAYTEPLSELTPQTTHIMGDSFYDPRTCYNMLALAYDFVYNYLKDNNTKVYDLSTQRYHSFNNDKAQKAFINMTGDVLKEFGKPDTHGARISNHPILTAPGVLYCILCIDDKKERDRLFDVFWEKGTQHQPSFKNTIMPMFSKQGIWPESLSYSFMPNITLILNIIDRIKPEMNVTKDYMRIFNGCFMFENLRMPDRRFVRFGDSKRNNDFTETSYRYTLAIAKRRGYKELADKAQVALELLYNAKKMKDAKLLDPVYDNSSYLDLFWGEPFPTGNTPKFDYKSTVLVDHAGVALQRNYVDKNNEEYGLCGIIGGASYVHSHVTGISMELYGCGYVMSPNAGLAATLPERLIPLNEQYFRLYAGNNTVVVNGTSHGLDKGSWKAKANVWQNKTVNIASEPLNLENPISKQFSFATQLLNDTVNKCLQERTLSTIRTSDTTAYYFDMFRSNSLVDNKFHDYIYHNIGDETIVSDSKGNAVPLSPTRRYQNDIGDVVHAPGWRYYEDTKTTPLTDDAVNVRFDLNFDHKYMHMFMPQGVDREYTKALAPATREAKNGYISKKTQVIVVRQNGEAWNRPFISVFEPSANKISSIKSVENLYDGKKIVGAKVVSQVEGKLITDYIICQNDDNASYINNSLKLKFQGRFAVVRKTVSGNGSKVELYIGKGKELSFNDDTLKALDNKGYQRIN